MSLCVCDMCLCVCVCQVLSIVRTKRIVQPEISYVKGDREKNDLIYI